MASTMLAEVEVSDLLLFNDVQLCLFTLGVRASYMRV